MLVLTRKSGEAITIGNTIKITVVEIKGKQVRIGVEAPPETSIHREEVYKRIQEENKLAAIRTSIDMDEIVSIWRRKVIKGEDN